MLERNAQVPLPPRRRRFSRLHALLLLLGLGLAGSAYRQVRLEQRASQAEADADFLLGVIDHEYEVKLELETRQVECLEKELRRTHPELFERSPAPARR